MSAPDQEKFQKRKGDLGIVYVAVASIAMIVFTFVVSNLDVSLRAKYVWLLPGALIYAGICFSIFRWQRSGVSGQSNEDSAGAFDADVDSKLAALADANEFFGASLRPDDLFRLVASRIAEIVPFDACVLHVRDADNGELMRKSASGHNARDFMSITGSHSNSLASQCVEKGITLNDIELQIESAAYPPEILKGFRSALATPLSLDGEPFGSLVVYSRDEEGFAADAQQRFAAAAERVAPLVASSFAFEKSIDNALTDPVTSLPNDRGFYLVLESRIAESHRFRDAKSLAVLAIDVSGFSDFNEAFGHAMGNRLLAHVASIAKGQLRQMDVLTRSGGDEFLVILPTANEVVTVDIIERLRKALEQQPFKMDHGTVFEIRLNFGSATFGADGETAQAMLQIARVKKQENKSKEGKVLFFPKETVN